MIKIEQGDALVLFKEIKDQSIDLIITDPPYNLNKNYGNGSDNKTFEDYIKFTEDWTTEAKRVLKPTGTLYVFMGYRFISYLYQILEQKQNLLFNSWISWCYTQGVGKTKGFSTRHEDVLMFNKSNKFIFNIDPIRVPQKYYRSVNNMRGANPGDVWEFSHIHYCQDNRQNHPTQKPEGLIERMVLASSNVGDIVLDPFSGSGTTLRVCQQLNRKCIGFELNSEYVEMTKKRLNSSFSSFDSIDPRMLRIPNDLNDDIYREEYLKNHFNWFLKNNNDYKEDFLKEIDQKYNKKIKQKKYDNSKQSSLFED